MDTTRIVTVLKPVDCQRLFQRRPVVVGSHALDRLSSAQRRELDPEQLRRTLLEETAQLAGRQRNDRLALYYPRGRYYLKLIVVEKPDRYEVVTFINASSLPSISRDAS